MEFNKRFAKIRQDQILKELRKESSLTSREIAKRTRILLTYVTEELALLKKSGLVLSIRASCSQTNRYVNFYSIP